MKMPWRAQREPNVDVAWVERKLCGDLLDDLGHDLPERTVQQTIDAGRMTDSPGALVTIACAEDVVERDVTTLHTNQRHLQRDRPSTGYGPADIVRDLEDEHTTSENVGDSGLFRRQRACQRSCPS